MPSAKVGERVYAIRNSDEETIYAYGPGVYAGLQKPPVGTRTCFGVIDEDWPETYVNPRIDLDNGGVVWGCQCWWGPEDEVSRSFGDRKVVIVPPRR